MARKARRKRTSCLIEDRSGEGPYLEVLRFAAAGVDEHGSKARVICLAVRQSPAFKKWQRENGP